MNKLIQSILAVLLVSLPAQLLAQAPTLGTAANFVLFSSAGAVTNTASSHLTGNVGTNSGSSTGFGNVDGVMHDNDATTATCAADLLVAYNQLNIATPTAFPAPLLGSGDVLFAGVYHIATLATLNGTLILDAQGNANAVFIFQVQGAFSTSAGAKVKLINGAQACNVFWKVEGLVSMAPATTMRGTIIAHNAAIAMTASDTLEGRALAMSGAVTLNSLVAYTPIGCGSAILTGPAAPALATTANYGVFSSNGPVTNTGITHVTGDVGTNLGLTTGFNPLFVSGMIHPIPDASTATCASDLLNVYSYLNTLPFDIQLLYPAQFGNDLVLTPHTYWLNGATAFTGNLYLNAQGNSNAVFVIQVNGALTTSTFSKVILINGAQFSNVYWKVDGAVDVYDNSIFKGNIIANNGAIHLRTGATLSGRALSTTGAVSIDAMDVSITGGVDAGTINGPSNVCVGSSITLTDTTTGGTWSSTNAHATVLGGVVTGVSAGTDTIRYIVTNTSGSDTATKIITISNAANAGTITGPSNVCTANSITLIDAATGGIWRRSNTHATVVNGVVTGVTTGIDTISYIVTNACGADTATKIITIGLPPNAGAISGPSSVCMGSVITLTESVTGGTWGRSNANATVIAGIVTGVLAGIDTIRYVVTNTCGADTATKAITVNPSPNAGAITGPSGVCVGSLITLTDTAIGGTWTATNTHATVVGGVVNGITAGIDTIRYTVVNGCGADTATKVVTISTFPNAGTITGASTVCTGTAITLTDAATGGIWSATNTHASVISGVVTGATAGIDTIRYTVTNSCGADTAAHVVTINPQPNAGTISGPSSVCTGNTISLIDAASGGVWTRTNTNATVAGGLVTGIASGLDTIRYIVTNTCGADTASHVVTVNPQPNAGTIAGASTVCTGDAITLTDAATGGIWSATNTHASVAGGVVTGATAGVDTIKYIVTNTCGADTAVKTVTVNATPALTSTLTPAAICDSATFSYSPASTVASTTYAWARAAVAGINNTANSGAGNVNETLYNTTNTNKTATYAYTLTAAGCSSVANVAVIVHPTPKMAILTDSVCNGAAFTFTPAALTAGTTFTWVRNPTTGVTGGASTGSGAITDNLSSTLSAPVNVIYTYTLNYASCSFVQNVGITLFPVIAAPAITTQSPSSVCTGTMYQNFGTATTPAVYETYNWTAVNAQVWAQGNNSQYAIVNYTAPGTATITLTAGVAGTACATTSSVAVIVGAGVAHTPTVSYFFSHFVCTPSDAASYQWGYDDANSLDSTMLAGEINQDYLCISPDYANKLYWVMTTGDGCAQKTYFNAPTAVQNVNAATVAIKVYPNPAADVVNVTITAAQQTAMQIEVLNMLGQNVATAQTIDNKATINVANLPAGSYIVACYSNGIKTATTRFTKN